MAQRETKPPSAAIAIVRPFGATLRLDPFGRFAGGRTSAITLPTNIAPAKASTNCTSKTFPPSTSNIVEGVVQRLCPNRSTPKLRKRIGGTWLDAADTTWGSLQFVNDGQKESGWAACADTIFCWVGGSDPSVVNEQPVLRPTNKPTLGNRQINPKTWSAL